MLTLSTRRFSRRRKKFKMPRLRTNGTKSKPRKRRKRRSRRSRKARRKKKVLIFLVKMGMVQTNLRKRRSNEKPPNQSRGKLGLLFTASSPTLKSLRGSKLLKRLKRNSK